MSVDMHMPGALHSKQFKHTSQRCFSPKIVSPGFFVSHYHGWHDREWRLPPRCRSTPCNALPWCAAFFLAQIPSCEREGETIASGECDDDVEHRAHVLPCLCTQIPHLQTVLKTGERNHEMKGQVLSTFNSNSDFNFPYFYLFASFPDHCGQPMKSIPRKEATFF
jgi:hypothetical protein